MNKLLIGITIAGALFAQERPKVLGVAHMAIYVKDLAKARQFYEDFLGYAEPSQAHSAWAAQYPSGSSPASTLLLSRWPPHHLTLRRSGIEGGSAHGAALQKDNMKLPVLQTKGPQGLQPQNMGD